ncbi:MAG: phosphotransferase [Intrasporangium sp.]|uniref:phosphotransferase n=1 Tax=Intrasporangium sp. TaxID=1925024 RepID=UPI003F80056E
MSRSALRLAALASSAVPGLDPVSVEGVPVHLGDLYEFAFLTDSQDRHWVVKASRSAAAGALLEDVSGLTALLARRLEIAVPVVRGVVALKTGRAVVHPRVAGDPLDFAALPPGAALTADVGRTLAHIHNLELLLFDEAGRPSYDAETHRKRMLSELDRASSTGHVPTGLLARWEHRLEDVSLWRFAPTPVHGDFTGSHVLASFDDGQDHGSGRVRGVVGWEEARVGDPADDLAELVAQAPPGALDTVLEAYVQSRVERPDGNLVRRARLAAEMSLVHALLRALSAGETRLVEHVAAELRDLDERIEEAERRAEARRLRAEREARRERELAQAAAAAAPSQDPHPEQRPSSSAAGSRGSSAPWGDEATQPFAGPIPDSADQLTQPFAAPTADSADQLTQPFAAPTADSADQLTQPFEPFPAPGSEQATEPFSPGLAPEAPASSPAAATSETDVADASSGEPVPNPSAIADPNAADALPGDAAGPHWTSREEDGSRSQAAPATTDGAPERSWQLSTAVDPEGLFEIDAVEPLPGAPEPGPEVGDALDDRHEGASDFVPVDRRHEGAPQDR